MSVTPLVTLLKPRFVILFSLFTVLASPQLAFAESAGGPSVIQTENGRWVALDLYLHRRQFSEEDDLETERFPLGRTRVAGLVGFDIARTEGDSAFDLALAQLRAWETTAPRITAVIAGTLQGLIHFSTIPQGLTRYQGFYLPADLEARRDRLTIDTVARYDAFFGPLVDTRVWSRTNRRSRASFYIHCALRRLQMFAPTEMTDARIGRLTATILLERASQDRNLDGPEYLGGRIASYLSRAPLPISRNPLLLRFFAQLTADEVLRLGALGERLPELRQLTAGNAAHATRWDRIAALANATTLVYDRTAYPVYTDVNAIYESFPADSRVRQLLDSSWRRRPVGNTPDFRFTTTHPHEKIFPDNGFITLLERALGLEPDAEREVYYSPRDVSWHFDDGLNRAPHQGSPYSFSRLERSAAFHKRIVERYLRDRGLLREGN